MAMTITLSESIAERLQAHANQFQLSADALAEKLLADALPVSKTNGFQLPPADDDLSSLEEVIAKIKAIPPNPAAIELGAKVGDMAYIQSLLDNPPTDTLTVAEWEEHWSAFEQELKALDRAQAIAEGQI